MIVDPGVEEQQILYTKVEWDADYGVEYTIQIRLRVLYHDDPTFPVWLDWEDLVTLRHYPPTSVASPYYDQNDYTENFITHQPWDYFDLDISGDDTPVEYRIVVETAGNKHRWFNVLPSAISADSKGFGPYPYTITYAQMFNQYVHTTNRLMRARLELPITLQYQQTSTSCNEPLVEKVIPGSGTNSTVVNCSSAGAGCVGMATPSAIRIDDRIPKCSCSSTSVSPLLDADDAVFSSGRSSGISQAIGYGGRYMAYIGRNDIITSWRVKPEQPSLNAIPPNLRQHVDGNSLGLLGYYTQSTSVSNLEYSSSFPGTTCCWSCCPCFYADPIARYKETVTQTQSSSCILTAGQVIVPPALPPADFNLRVDNYHPVGCAATYCATGGAQTGASFTSTYNNVGGGNLFVIIYPQ